MTGSNPLRRAARVVDTVASAGGELALREIAQALDLPQSTTHRLVHSLIDIGYLEANPATKTYNIGPRLKRVLHLALGRANLAHLARPILVELAEEVLETAFVAQLSGREVQLVDFVLPTRGSRTLVHPGFDFPINATAAGKAVFAHQPTEFVNGILAEGLIRHMDHTLADPDEVRAELKRVSERGYAINDAEYDAGVYAIAAPVSIGKLGVYAAVAIVGLRERILASGNADNVAKLVREAAEELSRLTSSPRFGL